MKIKLKILQHQVDSINAIKNVFKNIKLKNGKDIYQNPIFDPKDNKFIENIQKIQNGDIEGLKKINVPKKFDNSSKRRKKNRIRATCNRCKNGNRNRKNLLLYTNDV